MNAKQRRKATRKGWVASPPETENEKRLKNAVARLGHEGVIVVAAPYLPPTPPMPRVSALLDEILVEAVLNDTLRSRR